MSDKTPEWVSYVPLKWVPAPNVVQTSKLTPTDKQQLWRGVQHRNPALANMLKSDPAIKALQREFNATVIFEQPEFDAYMKAGI